MPQELSKEQLFDAIITTGLPIGLFIVNQDLRIVEFNRTAEELTGWRREEALGMPCSEVLQSSLCNDHCPLQRSADQRKAFIGEKAVIRSRWGEEVPIRFTSSAILDREGRMIAGFEIFEDASEQNKLESQRQNFISVFTHDLKHPVAIIGGFLERLLAGKAGPLTEKQRQYLEAVSRENQKLSVYIQNFLDTLRLEAGRIKLELAPCDLAALLGELVAEFQVRAEKKGIRLRLELPPALPAVLLDRVQIERALGNLVDNAIKFSEPDSTVTVRAREEQDFVVVEVEDQGPGIAREDLPHVFEYFYRARRDNDLVTGTGLGLASARGIVEAHGGKIWVRSSPGNGSLFSVRLPRSAQRAVSCPAHSRND